jgi:hypothetical protein
MSKLVRTIPVAVVAALVLSAGTSSAGAAVTIGQTANPAINCGVFDRVQPTVTSGTAYVVPPTVASGTITSWSTQAGNNAGPLAMKVYRPLGGNTYQVVGLNGPHALTPNVLNTFPTNVAVRAGDVLGNSTPVDTGPVCTFTVAGEFYLRRAGNLADGSQGTFDLFAGDRRLNVSAVINPTNTFTLGAITRNKKKGIAFITATVPNPGELTLSGKGLKAITRTAGAPGSVQLKVKATGKKKNKLNETGKVKTNPAVTYRPTGGDPSSQSRRVQLKKLL